MLLITRSVAIVFNLLFAAMIIWCIKDGLPRNGIWISNVTLLGALVGQAVSAVSLMFR